MRGALGMAVFSGMLGVTVFGIFFTPVFYVVIRWLTGNAKGAAVRVAEPDAGKTLAADGQAFHDPHAHKAATLPVAPSEAAARKG
jgi:multidrug efflux pump